jgi:putative heme-binding domain-containing protein
LSEIYHEVLCNKIIENSSNFMKKTVLTLLATVAVFVVVALLILRLFNTQKINPCSPATSNAYAAFSDSLSQNLNWPDDLDITVFSGPNLTPSPASLGVAPTGDVYVGVDMQGSLGKEMGRGKIVRLVDCNNDGILDSNTIFAEVDNPRGIIPMGDKVFVLYTTFSAEDSLATGQDLVVFEDKNGDGVSDGPPEPLIEGIGNPNYIQSRGTDHATNGIQFGVDGWIYISVGDFGFHEAVDREGTTLTMLGGGVVRVRPDGTGMEEYTHGFRNIYDVAIDPYMNIFTRGNTNDGKNWNVRFSHHVQTGEYGYTTLFMNFTEEIIPALVDVGGGSGAGALYMDDDRWPAQYNHVPLMADWGRNILFMHHVNPANGSFEQEEEEFVELPQITDLDIDASGTLYMSAWDGAGFRGDSARGYIVRAVPEGFEVSDFPNLQNVSLEELGQYLQSESAKARQYAQYELLQRPAADAAEVAWQIASNNQLPLDIRVAGIFTYSQIAGENGIDNLVELTGDDTVQEFALRALADRKDYIDQVPAEPFLTALDDSSDRVKIAAIVGLGRMGRPEATQALLDIPIPPSFESPDPRTEGPHASPNPAIIPAHVAVKALVDIGDAEQILDAVESEQNELALWALRYIHQQQVPERLITIYQDSDDAELRNQILHNLARIYHREAPYDGSWWWSTRPDNHGPYYRAIEWGATPLIRDFLLNVWRQSPAEEEQLFAHLNSKYRLEISEFGVTEVPEEPVVEEQEVDFEELASREGQVGEASIEDVMLALESLTEDREVNEERGRELFVELACSACHSIDPQETPKGPYLGQIGGIMTRDQIAEAILEPNASISQGFATVQIQTEDGVSYIGFVTEESADELVIRNIAGQATTIEQASITSRQELESSIMPAGLVNSLSYDEFTTLVNYLAEQVE